MSFIPSLLIYNPLEALFLIMFCDIFTKRKFTLSTIGHAYGLGFINLLIQSVNNFIADGIIKGAYIMIASTVMLGLVLMTYYLVMFGISVNLKTIVLTVAVLSICVSLGILFTDVFFGYAFNGVHVNTLFEFINNMIIVLVRFSALFITRFLYEKFFRDAN